GIQHSAAGLIGFEADANYPEVANQCRVIQSDTRIVVVDPEIAERIRRRKPVLRLEVIRNSVQMYHTKIEKPEFGLPRIRSDLDIYRLPESWDYDPDFLGYMADVIRLHAASEANGYFV
ncbi:MAG: hypothetical protein AAF585_21065, partial [Verrucomicrobiota bacterium]